MFFFYKLSCITEIYLALYPACIIFATNKSAGLNSNGRCTAFCLYYIGCKDNVS